MLASLVGKYSVIKRESDAALETIAELEGSLNQDGTLNQTQIELLRSHSRHLEDLSLAVGYFRLQDAPQESTVSMQDVGIDDARDIKEEGNEPFGLARG